MFNVQLKSDYFVSTPLIQICSLLRGGIAERGGVRVGHRIIEINNQSVVAVPHEKIVNLLATSVGEVCFSTYLFDIKAERTKEKLIEYILFTDSNEDDANIYVPAIDWPGKSCLYLNFTFNFASIENEQLIYKFSLSKKKKTQSGCIEKQFPCTL